MVVLDQPVGVVPTGFLFLYPSFRQCDGLSLIVDAYRRCVRTLMRIQTLVLQGFPAFHR